MLAQIAAVIRMNLLSLPARAWLSISAVLAVAVVVGVLLSFLAMANGFERTLRGAGSDVSAIITRRGARSELSSVLPKTAIAALATAPGIARDGDGNPIYSAELYVVVDGVKRDTQSEANLPLRGIAQAGLSLRGDVSIVAGRMFEAGRNEIIVGRGVALDFDGFELGKEVTFGKSTWTVVGVFSTGGSAFESELWADVAAVQAQFRRSNSFQTMRMKLAEPGNLQPLLEYAKTVPRLIVDIQTESEFYASQGRAIRGLVYFGWGLSIVLALGALAGALNTMFTSVAQRTREIATLRAMGYSGLSAFVGTMTESVLLSIVGGVIGAVCAYGFLDGVSASTLGASFTQVVFRLQLSPELILQGVLVAVVIGLVGGTFPAWQAARLPVRAAFR